MIVYNKNHSKSDLNFNIENRIRSNFEINKTKPKQNISTKNRKKNQIMDDFEDDCNSNGGENWIQSQKYTNWEIECINRLETSPDLEQQIEVEKGGNSHI